MSLKDLVLRYFFSKNAKNIFKIFLGNSVFKARKNGNENSSFQTIISVMPYYRAFVSVEVYFLSLEGLKYLNINFFA
nr:hypothetical protein [uncultured Campylobacter sp.]